MKSLLVLFSLLCRICCEGQNNTWIIQSAFDGGVITNTNVVELDAPSVMYATIASPDLGSLMQRWTKIEDVNGIYLLPEQGSPYNSVSVYAAEDLFALDENWKITVVCGEATTLQSHWTYHCLSNTGKGNFLARLPCNETDSRQHWYFIKA